jgi:hypothetical protein
MCVGTGSVASVSGVLDHYFFLRNRRLIDAVIILLHHYLICAVAGTSGNHAVANMTRNGYTMKTSVYHLLRGKVHQTYIHTQKV